MKKLFLSLTMLSAFSTLAADFVGAGEKGRSGAFNNILTVYTDTHDPQPRCLGCRAVRVIYDGIRGAAGETHPQALDYRVVYKDGKVLSETQSASMRAMYRTRNSPTMSKVMLHFRAPHEDITDLVVEFDVKGPRCLNPTIEECSELVVQYQYDVNLDEILSAELRNVKESGYPNRVQQ